MQTITTIGLDIAKSVFQVMGLMPAAKWSFPPVEAPPRPGVLPEAAGMPCRHRSLRLVTPLVARAAGTGSHGAVDPASLCEALRQEAEE